MTVSITREMFISKEKQRFLQALPTVLGLCMTMYMPFAARKSLKVWRALQVYDAQKPPKKGFTGEKRMSRLELFSIVFWCFSPSILLLIAFIPVKDEAKWPIFSAFRLYIPFIFFAYVLSFSLSDLFAPLILPIQRVGRNLDAKLDKKTKQKSPANVTITRDSTTRNPMAIFFVLLNIIIPAAIAYFFAHSTDSTLIVIVTAFVSAFVYSRSLILPATFGHNVSLRSHVRYLVMIFIATISFVAIVIAIVNSVDNITSSSIKSPEKAKEREKDLDNRDLIIGQMICLLYSSIWPLHMSLPAFLMTLAYRFDIANEGLSKVSDEQKKQAIRESKEMAKHCMSLKHPDHPFDNVGRVPILLDSIALRFSEEEPKCALPTFIATMKAMISVQFASLFIIWEFLPSWFNVSYFVRSKEALLVFPLPYSFNFGILFAYFAIAPVMLFSVGYHAKQRGQTFAAGLRALWTYEEKWQANYLQTKIDHQIYLMDTREELEGKEGEEETLLADHLRDDLGDRQATTV